MPSGPTETILPDIEPSVRAFFEHEKERELPGPVLNELMGRYEALLENALREDSDLFYRGRNTRERYAVSGALNLLRALKRSIPEFPKSPEISEVSPEARTLLDDVQSVRLTPETIHDFLETRVVPLALFAREQFSKWSVEKHGKVLRTTKELRYADQLWRTERVALDTATNHLPSDSGATQFAARFEIEDDDGNLEWKDVSKLLSPPDFKRVKRVILEDNGRGYPSDEVARENPMKRQAVGTAGEHGEGLLMAALACVRGNIELVYESRDWAASAVAFPEKDDPDDPKSPHGWYLSYLLTAESFKRQGARTVFERVTPTLARNIYDLRENLVYFMPHQVMGVAHEEGEVLRLMAAEGEAEPRNKIYIKGVYSTYEPKGRLLFSYNLNIATPRDRHYIPDLEENLVRVFTNSCTPQMANRMLDCAARRKGEAGWYIDRGMSAYGEDTSYYYEISHLLPVLEGDCPPTCQDIFRAAFETKFGKNAVIATNSEATELFGRQQRGITKGKTLVYVTKNMATFLRRACGVPFDIDVVQFPKEIDRSTSFALEMIDIKRTGLERALFDLIAVHFENSGKQTVQVKFECEGETALCTFKDLRDRKELQHKVKRIEIHTEGPGIEEASIRLNVGAAQRAKLPDALGAILSRGIQPKIQSRNWEAEGRIQPEVVGGETFRSVAYDVQQYTSEMFPGISTTLQPLDGAAYLPAEAIQNLMKISGEVYYLDPERFGKPLFQTKEGVVVLADGELSGLVFMGGDPRVRYSIGVFNYLIPEPVWKGSEEEINLFLGSILFQNFPTENRNACIRFLQQRIFTIESPEAAQREAPNAESRLLRDFLKVTSKEKSLDKERRLWRDIFYAACGSDRAVLRDPNSAEKRSPVATFTDVWAGKRSEFSRGDWFLNTRLHRRKMVDVTSAEFRQFLMETGVSLDTSLSMKYLPFFERNPWVSKSIQGTTKAIALAVAFTLAGDIALNISDEQFDIWSQTPEGIQIHFWKISQALLMGVFVAGAGFILTGVGVSAFQEFNEWKRRPRPPPPPPKLTKASQPPERPFLQRHPEVSVGMTNTAKAVAISVGLTAGGIVALNIYDGLRGAPPDDQNDLYSETYEGTKIHLSTILKALLVGAGFAGLAFGARRAHGEFVQWKSDRHKRKIIDTLSHIFGEFSQQYDLFHYIRFKWRESGQADYEFDKETETIFIKPSLLGKKDDASIVRSVAEHAIDRFVDAMPEEKAKDALRRILHSQSQKRTSKI